MSRESKTPTTIVCARHRSWAIAATAAGTIVVASLGAVACSGAGSDEAVDDTVEQVTATGAVDPTSAADSTVDPSATTPAGLTTTTNTPSTAPRLDPNKIPKFVNQFQRLPTYKPNVVRDSRGNVVRKEFNVSIAKFFDQQLPPPFPKTLLFGYGGNVKVGSNCPITEENQQRVVAAGNCLSTFRRTSPGPIFEQTRLIPAKITYNNQLAGSHPLPVDPTLDWANPNKFPKPSPPFAPFPPGYPQAQSPIPHVTHTHGIEVLPEFDGTPDLWFTPNGIHGPEFVSNTYTQPSSNQSAAFWYHDHSFGITRLDVGMGLSSFSFLRDPANALDNPPSGKPDVLPRGEFEVPMIVQDRSYRTDGSIFYPVAQQSDPTQPGIVPDVHPYWVLLNDQDTILVNGRVWPNMNVKRALYRFRILNSSNQRFMDFKFSNDMSFRTIESDGGFLRSAVTVNDVLIGVTERTDLLVDFRNIAPGTKIVMQNIEQRNPPVGPPPDPNNDGLVMQFTVTNDPVVPPPAPLPATLNTIPTLTPDRPTRMLIQNVQTDESGRILQAELDGQLFHELTTELPTVGATEDWEFINTTPLTHNKHIHLIQFQVIDRRNIDAPRYLADWRAVNGNPPFDHPTLKLPIEPYVTGAPEGPRPEESGWKDTVRTPANQVTRIRVRWAIQTAASNIAVGQNTFPINPVDGVGYIWHCHLLEHEDNEMMRPLTVIPTWKAGTSYPVGFRGSPGTQKGLVDFNGVDYQARVANSSTQSPDQRPDLWERINNQNGDWAIQTIYNVGDLVFFQGNVYRALQQHQAKAGLEPTNAPTFWALVTPIPS